MRQHSLLQLLRGLGGFLLTGGVIGLGWTLWPIWRTVEIDPRMLITDIAPVPMATAPIILGTVDNRTWLPLVGNQPVQEVEAITVEPVSAEPAMVEPNENEIGVYLSGGEKVVVRITPPEVVNAGRSIKIAFYPGDACEYGTRQACVSRHWNGQVTLLTIHSGLGGEGESFRSAMEGTGLNLTFYSIDQIQHNLEMLTGAPVSIQSGESGRDDLRLSAVVRLPPAKLEAYFTRPFDDTMAELAEDNPFFQEALESGESLLVFEICGWQIPGEPWAPEVSPTTASIYLGVIPIP